MQKTKIDPSLQEVRDCISPFLENAIESNFKFYDNEEISAEKKNLLTKKIMDQIIERTIQDESEDNKFGYITFLGRCALFVVHTEPSFYSGSHSFTWHEILRQENFPKMTETGQKDYFPEFYDNEYFSDIEREQVDVLTSMEIIKVKNRMLGEMENCCKDGNCKASGIFQEDEVCFGSACAKFKHSRTIELPCNVSGECFKKCVPYKVFLTAFSQNNMKGDVDGNLIGLEDLILEESQADTIRASWKKELKMLMKFSKKSA